MNKVLKSYRFNERTLERLECILETREKLNNYGYHYYNYNRTELIELLIWGEAQRLENILKKEEEEREP